MVNPQRPRRGHSLVELIVALAFLGTTLTVIAATGLVATRHASRAIRAQEAAARAAEALDSLLTAGPTEAGGWSGDGLRLEWRVEPAADGWSRVIVRGLDPGTGQPLVRLDAGWAPPPPVEDGPEP